MALTDISIRGARPQAKPYKLSDGAGLVLLVNPNGSKWWRLRYRFHGREKMLSLGIYPQVPLKLARERHSEARRLLATGQDPSAKRMAEKATLGITFEVVAREWLQLQRNALKDVTLRKARWMLEAFVFPKLGSRPIRHLTAPDFLPALRDIETRGASETARRTKQRCGQVLRYAIATGRADRDVTVDLRGALAPVVAKHYAAITKPADIGALMRAIDGYDGEEATKCALKLSALLFPRPGELRAAEWREIDLERAEWRIPAVRMKMGEEHIVPLSRQALDVLRRLPVLTHSARRLFPSAGSHDKPMSENTLNAALRRMGYGKSEMTAHGFRALASTALNELGWAPDVVELQLAHAERNKVRSAYNRAARLQERREMMQAWADYLEKLRDVHPLPTDPGRLT